MILYAPGTTEFNTNGIGQLSDAVSCIVEEKRNGSYELEMVYPVDGIHFSEIEHSCIITAKPADGKDPQPFRIYSIRKPIGGKATIKAEHISYQLTHIPVDQIAEPLTSPSAALAALKAAAAESCPFTFWTDKTSTGTFAVKEPGSLRSKLGGTQGSILDAFGGGEYEWDGYTVKLHQNRGLDHGVVLRYGKNITDIEQEASIENTITGIYPYWKSSDTSGNVTVVTLPEKVIHHTNAQNFPYQRTAVLDCSGQFQQPPTETELRAYATAYMSDNGIGIPKVSIKISFVALWQTEEYRLVAPLERVNLCDTVTVVFEKLGISVSAKVVRTKYDVLKERYDEIELGDAKTSLAQSIRQEISTATSTAAVESTSFLRAKMLELEGLIAGATDGNIVFNYDANGNRTQILAMDTQDIQTATKVLVINYAGIGGYSGGYGSSNFHLGITTDGQVVAESIAAGTLMAALVLGSTFRVGGSTNGNGSILIYDANDNLIGQWDKNGLTVYKGTIQGPNIIVGGLDNVNGSITVKNAFGTVIGKWDKDGADIAGQIKNIISVPIWGNLNVDHYADAEIQIKGVAVQMYRENALCGIISQAPSLAAENYNSFYKDSIRVDHHMYVLGGTHLTLGLACSSSGAQQVSTENNYRCIELSYKSGYTSNILIEFIKAAYFHYEAIFGGYIYSATKAANIHFTTYGNVYSGSMVLDADGNISLNPGNKAYYGTNREIATVSTSSRRYKHSIKPIEDEDLSPRRLLDLQVVQFVFNDDHELQYPDMKGRTVPGIIAEDVAEIYPAAVIRDKETGLVESWDERRILPGMLALLQEQDAKIKEQEEKIKSLEKRLEKLERLLT